MDSPATPPSTPPSASPATLPAASPERTTAVVTMELQRGVVGDLATIAELTDACARRGVLERCGQLVAAARSAVVPVVHCLAEWRADRRGTPLNTPMARALAANPAQVLAGTAAVDPVAELGDTSGDLFSTRRHGMAPFHGTDLDPLLRSVGATHLVVCGVSLNVGVTGLVLGAVDRGYEVTVATDATVGVPIDYGDAVVRHTLAPLARLRTVGEITSSWAVPSPE